MQIVHLTALGLKHQIIINISGGRVRPITSIMPSQITESAKVHTAVNEIDKFR